jgi:TatD DNase family protein
LFIDTHTHIHQHDRDETSDIVNRAIASKVDAIITAGVNIEDSRQAIRVAEQYDPVFAGIGVHPTSLTGPLLDRDIADLDDMAGSSQVVVMSEIGIDHQERSPDRTWQENAFRSQITLAHDHGLALIFHARENGDDYDAHSARDTIIDILKNENAGELGGVAHYFQGRWSHAKRFLDMGFHISFAKTLIRIPDLEETAQKTPSDRILLETDSYPQPFKKKREKWTEPRDLPLIAEKLAALRDTSVEEIARITKGNTLKLFGSRSQFVNAVLDPPLP